MDRRVARTRALLRNAHLALVVEKGYDAVTVEDICRAANVGRSTFYAHYADKDDLHRSGLETLRQQLAAHAAERDHGGGVSAERLLAFSLPMLEHAREHLDLYRALAGSRGGAAAVETIRDILQSQVRAELPREAGGDALRELTVQHLVGAYLAVLTWWLDGGAKQAPEQVDAAFRRLAISGLSTFQTA